MEPIKVSVDVNLHLSERTEQFILGLFSGNKPASQAPATPAKPESKPASQVPATPAKPESKPASQAPATPAKSESNVSIDDVRKALSSKIATHRSEIKDKLAELGAPSVTKLDQSKYQDMLDFLNTLD